MVRHNLAKVRVIPDREQALEWALPETRAIGWAGGGLGCWRCNARKSQPFWVVSWRLQDHQT
ncbi:hypothetical protein AYK26_05915 [Euryarchaeota archaeon SM23-78]|nr:MAG: hypothetical protein AYK26_05915 [Euryarchaeota archaeon SM23-78]